MEGDAGPEPGGRPGTVFDRRAAALGFLVFLFFAGGASMIFRSGRAPGGPVDQPIAFNHKKHVKDLDLACSTCHAYYEKESFSGIPGSDVCISCHAEAQGKSDEEAKLVKLLTSGAPLVWKPLFRQPPHVFYSHRRHVVVAKLDCTVCHGAIAETSTPPRRVKRLVMDDCLGCHRQKGVPTDCTACHR